jgi:hypothetical protein
LRKGKDACYYHQIYQQISFNIYFSTLKGAYRVALWAFIVEVVFHAIEVWRGTMALADTAGVLGACAVMILWMTVQYKSYLYPEGIKKE